MNLLTSEWCLICPIGFLERRWMPWASVRKWFIHGSPASILTRFSEAIFDSHFNALDNNDNPLANAYANIMFVSSNSLNIVYWLNIIYCRTDTFATMTKGEIMKQTLVGYLPKFALSYLHKQFPNVRMEKLKKAYTVGRKVAKEMIETKSQACLEGKGARDILSLLGTSRELPGDESWLTCIVRANASHDKGSRLSDEEMTAQVLYVFEFLLTRVNGDRGLCVVIIGLYSLRDMIHLPQH